MIQWIKVFGADAFAAPRPWSTVRGGFGFNIFL